MFSAYSFMLQGHKTKHNNNNNNNNNRIYIADFTGWINTHVAQSKEL